jgi:serine protease Do
MVRHITGGRALGVTVLGSLVALATCAPTPHETTPDKAVAARDDAEAASIPDIAERSVQSVVNVSSTRRVRVGRGGSPLEDPMFRFFFGPGGPGGGDEEGPGPERGEQSLGSGVIVDPAGVILTNNHVVQGADEIKVTLSDGRDVDATVVGTDPKSDVAVIKLKEKIADLRALPFGDSDKLRLGETVLAIGNPFGLGQTVSKGIVSAKGRDHVGIVDYEDFIQTDAAINPGNSGGALVDTRGELVGINTAIASRTGSFSGIGFAIPANMAHQIMNSLVKYGKVRRGWLGVAIQDLDADLAKSLGLSVNRGVLVSEVSKGSPAAKAGLERGDVVVSLGGQKVTSSSEFRNQVALLGPDAKAEIEVVRGGQHRSYTVTLGELPKELGGGGGDEEGSSSADEGPLAGVTVSAITPEARRRLDLPPDVDSGVVVTEVDPRSPARAAGVRPGDVLLEVNRQAVSSPEDFDRAASKARDNALLLLVREGHTLFVVVKK